MKLKHLTVTIAALLAACAAQAAFSLSFTFAPQFLSGTDDQGITGSTWTVSFELTGSTYDSGFISTPVTTASNVTLTVSGSSVPANNGTFNLVESTTTTFAVSPSFFGQMSLLTNTQSPPGPSGFTFGTTSVSNFGPVGTQLVSLSPGASIQASDYAGGSVSDTSVNIGSAIFTMPASTVVVPEPSTYASLLGVTMIVLAFWWRRRK